MYYLKQVFYILIYLNFVFIPVMQIWIFSIITSVLGVTWSFKDNLNMLIWCSRNIYYYYQFLTELYIIVESVVHFFKII